MPEWMSYGAVARLLESGVYVVRRIDGQDVAEPREGRGPAYVHLWEMGWWQFIYDVAVGVDVAVEVLVC